MADREKIIKLIEEEINVCESVDQCYRTIDLPALRDILELLKEQEVRELTIDEWYEWKANQRRDPICMLWENDTSPMWILNPNDVHEPALLIGKLKLFNGKPTHEQCKAIKWD